MGLANERQCYNVMLSLIGWAHTQNGPQYCFDLHNENVCWSGNSIPTVERKRVFPQVLTPPRSQGQVLIPRSRSNLLVMRTSLQINLLCGFWFWVVSRWFSVYCQVSNIRRTKSQHLKDSRTVLRLSLPNPLKPDVKSRCSWSSADRRCSNYIWVIDNFIAY